MSKPKKSSKESGLKTIDTSKSKKKTTKRKTRNKSKIALITSKPKIQVKQYIHEKEKRINNPPVGLVTPETDKSMPPKKYSFDSYIDPELQWSGKLENSEFSTDTVSLHVHERIDPATIIEQIMKDKELEQKTLFHYFDQPENNPPLNKAIEFYKHHQNWENQLITGDSLLVMNSLLEKGEMGNQVQMIFMDPPYGITYKSNFQPFVNNRSVSAGDDKDLTEEPEMIKAFRDTWELEIHSYLTYVRERLLLCKSLLAESGSIFIQIGEKNYHHIREIMDEVFESKNFCSSIIFRKTGGESTTLLATTYDYLIWYAKDIKKVKFNQLYFEKQPGEEGAKEFTNVELSNGDIRRITPEELVNPKLLPKGAEVFATWPIVTTGYSENNSQPIEVEYEGKKFILKCANNTHWSVGVEGTKNLWNQGRLLRREGVRIFKKYLSDFPYSPYNSLWLDTRGETKMTYAVQTSAKVVMRCIMMTTDPGDLVFDPTCGSGTTAYSAERYGRRWITCDTSRVSIALTRQRLMTAVFPYYKLLHPDDGIDGGFEYAKAENKVISSYAHGREGKKITLFNLPKIDVDKVRVSGPISIEAVSGIDVRSLEEDEKSGSDLISNKEITDQYRQWRNELLRTGVIGKNGQKIQFSRVDLRTDTKWIHAEAETKEDNPKNVLIAFGDRYAPMKKKQVHKALFEAQQIVPKPKILLYAAFQFDSIAENDIAKINWPDVKLLGAKMNPDLNTKDLKKNSYTNESFWLLG